MPGILHRGGKTESVQPCMDRGCLEAVSTGNSLGNDEKIRSDVCLLHPVHKQEWGAAADLNQSIPQTDSENTHTQVNRIIQGRAKCAQCSKALPDKCALFVAAPWQFTERSSRLDKRPETVGSGHRISVLESEWTHVVLTLLGHVSLNVRLIASVVPTDTTYRDI
jgi:hypothetical protein